MHAWLSPLPLVAILRGLHPDQAADVGCAIADAGFHILEVPLNSPRPLKSIARLTEVLGDRCLIGAGTVLDAASVAEVAAAGGRIIVMPHTDPAVIAAAKDAGLRCVPGVATPSEAFAALRAGADAVKAFPAEQITPAVLRAWRAVLPRNTAVLPVGGITPDNMPTYIEAGAAGFGIGSALFKPGRSIDDIHRAAQRFAQAWPATDEAHGDRP
ncbi:2-dehydro-3-deoxy-6-phosphogalactonate aldolase [Oleiagrimonas soli]|uniref:2-dehydro-3-deoxy-6-phosphogalactonate aldolase n=1 Tax=Oleiagrimonas soli TaxID=1543381 RepID=A0A099CZ77_9GAMM|nr:2-dehydro-3-deoxy-6-phosphogalactonate aldolase [Oleiagrimonas soli]KGI78966.1 2-dehydro-3-deoxy-6-phosphogalactonate aldolase [Oleiagrimonas soli]MBB6184518.1 2-dehydro-3-deoxyphosphogalactonate aldolase [Oleiagrimonas soli]